MALCDEIWRSVTKYGAIMLHQDTRDHQTSLQCHLTPLHLTASLLVKASILRNETPHVVFSLLQILLKVAPHLYILSREDHLKQTRLPSFQSHCYYLDAGNVTVIGRTLATSLLLVGRWQRRVTSLLLVGRWQRRVTSLLAK